MANRIAWLPSTDIGVASYRIERSAQLNSGWTVIATIPNDQGGPNFQDGQFFYIDTGGTPALFYRLSSVAADDEVSLPSMPFQASTMAPQGIPTGVRIDHNYPTANAMCYLAANGTPVEGAAVRVFRLADFDTGAPPVGVTLIDKDGHWMTPVFVNAGLTYRVHFEKPGYYGPDTIDVIA